MSVSPHVLGITKKKILKKDDKHTHAHIDTHKFLSKVQEDVLMRIRRGKHGKQHH